MVPPRRSPRFKAPEISSTTTSLAPKAVATSDDPAPKTTAKRIAEAASPEEEATSADPSPPKKQRTRGVQKKNSPEKRGKKKRQRRKVLPAPGSKTPPAGWEEIYSLVEELRQDKSAPLDEAGAEVLPEKSVSKKVYRFQVLMALMLSSQTKDAVVRDAMRKLQQHGLTVENIAHNTTREQLDKMIGKVGFHNRKTGYIKKAVQILLDKYNGDIPKTAQEMIDDLPGVGEKMAYLVETIAWGTTSGIGVDTHMHRIFNQINWVPNTKNPEQTRVELEAWLPKEHWPLVNYYWVGFGQETQQQKPKILRKALNCSRPAAALKLLKRVGLDPIKEGEKAGCLDEVKEALKQK